MTPQTSNLARRLLAGAAAVLVLLATLTLYTRPDFMVHLADQLWSCF